MSLTIPLEDNPEMAALVGFIIGHTSFLGTQFDLMYQCVGDLAHYEDFVKRPELGKNGKRRHLKRAAKEILPETLYAELAAFCDGTADKLVSRRHEIAHHIWASGPDMDTFHLIPNRKDGNHETVQAGDLKSLLEEYKKANQRAQKLLLAIYSESPKAPKILSLKP